jgi:hypothetical protein
MACSDATVKVFLIDRMSINKLTHMNVDKRFPAAVQGASKLTVICNVPNIDFM